MAARSTSPMQSADSSEPSRSSSRPRVGRGCTASTACRNRWKPDAFVAWARAWGFNRQGEPEVFPKTTKNTQAWLPNEPNDQGGDAYVSGSFESCIVQSLPTAPTAKLTTTTLHFLRGFVREPGRNDALNKAAFELGTKRVEHAEANRLCLLGARLCGLEAEEPDQTRTTLASGFEAGSRSAPPIDPTLNGHASSSDATFPQARWHRQR